MFDLFRSRAKAMRYLLTALLSLVALSMVVTLIPGFGTGMYGPGEQVIAEIGDDVLPARTVHQLIQAQVREQRLSREMVELLAPQMINQMVAEMATMYQARRMGFAVTDEELVQEIRKLMPQLFQGGQFVGAEAYTQVLAQMNMTIPEFESTVRKQILLGKLQGIIFEGVIVTPSEVEAEYQKRAEKVKLDVVKFEAADYRSRVSPSRAEIEEHFKQHQASFEMLPRRSFDLIVVDEAGLAEAAPITEAQVKQAYQSNMERWRVDERVNVRHILVKADEGDAPARTKAKARAEDLLKQIRAGADFAELARKNSEDPGSAAKGGDLGFITHGQTVAPFETAAFSLKPKEISNVVETIFGFHIIQVLGKEPARVKPLEEVKEELMTELKRRQVYERMPELAEQARAGLVKAPDQAEQIASRLRLKFAKVDSAGIGDVLPHVGVSSELESNIGPLPKGGVTPVIQIGSDKLVVAVVREIIEGRLAELREVEDKVREAVIERKVREMAEAKAREFEERLKANKNDLRKTAQELGVKVISTNEFERTGQIEGIGPAASLGEQPFVNPVGAVVGIYRVAATPYFFKILSRTPADPAGLEASRDAIVSALKDRKLRERRELFEEGLVRLLTEEGKIKINQDAIKRLVASYRG